MDIAFFHFFVLVTALSLDAFAASFIYGTDKVKIPFSSVSIIAGLSTGILLVFLLAGQWFGSLIPEKATSILCFLILFVLGIAKLFDSTLKSLIRRSGIGRKNVRFSVSDLNFILTVYANPEKANGEDISILSPAEALSLGLALSLDSAAAGLGAGITGSGLFLVCILSLLLNTLAILAGSLMGRSMAKRTAFDLSWLSGILLIALALARFW